jgi:hypothetical protein
MQNLIDDINEFGYFVQLYQYSHSGRWEAQATVKGGKSIEGHFAFADTHLAALEGLLAKTQHIGNAIKNAHKASVTSFHNNKDPEAGSAAPVNKDQKPKAYDPFEDDAPATQEKDAFE